ncbi:MAG: TQO small subunit DoxD [Dermatophilaceae bacterium]
MTLGDRTWARSGWSRLRTRPEWMLLPLRLFLGVTFTYASLQKLADPGYLDPNNPGSAVHQMLRLRDSSPIGPMLSLSAHAPTLVSLTIALAELAVGLGTLLGLWTRVAAAGGAFLSLTFFLTVSWNTTPYYYGADIVFLFAWSVMFAFGAANGLSVDSWLRNRARGDLRLGPEPTAVSIDVPRLRKLCGRGQKCGLAPDGQCTRLAGCPVFPVHESLTAGQEQELRRRTMVLGGAAVGGAGALALLGGGITALIGRVLGRSSTPTAQAAGPVGSTPSPATSTPAPDIVVAAASAVPVGGAVSFTAADGNPAWVVHPSGDTFVAFSAVCTHLGCTVRFEQSTAELFCPCHGGLYDARNGQVLQGPPPSPLPPIAVQVVNGQIRVQGTTSGAAGGPQGSPGTRSPGDQEVEQ